MLTCCYVGPVSALYYDAALHLERAPLLDEQEVLQDFLATYACDHGILEQKGRPAIIRKRLIYRDENFALLGSTLGVGV